MDMTIAPIIPVQKNDVMVVSWRAAYLVSRLYKANMRAATRGIIACKENTVLDGFNMIMTPTKPIKMAVQRFHPTYSFKTGPDKAATRRG